jgi:hypothetical protein
VRLGLTATALPQVAASGAAHDAAGHGYKTSVGTHPASKDRALAAILSIWTRFCSTPPGQAGDPGGTFMFGEDRLSEREDFAATYRAVGGSSRTRAEARCGGEAVPDKAPAAPIEFAPG